MFCASCGSENPDDARFCGRCGAPVEGPPPGPGEPSGGVVPVVDLATPVEAVPPGLKWGILAISVLVPIVGVFMVAYYWVKGGSEEKRQPDQSQPGLLHPMRPARVILWI